MHAWTRSLIFAAAVGALLGACTPSRRVADAAIADSTAPVLAAVQRLFDAMAARDTAAARAALLPGAHFRALRSDTTPAPPPRVQSDTAFLRTLAMRPERLRERIWAPVVRVEGPLATVWAPYEFHIDGRWSHCGVDAVTLVRTAAAGWQVAGIDYTVQRRGCPPSAAGEVR